MKETPTEKRTEARDHAARTNRSVSRKTILLWALLVLALIAALPSAYLTLKLTQQPAPLVLSPAAINRAAAVPRVFDPERREAKFIDQMISRMSLDEELGQMMIVGYEGHGTFNSVFQYMIANQHVGGSILYTFNGNIQTIPQTAALNAACQAAATIPLFVSTDQEGGPVNRLDSIAGYRPSAREMAATHDPNVAAQEGASDGQMLKQMGINLDLAPVVDVQTLSDSTLDASPMAGFEYREFGTTPQQVTTFAGAYLNGLQGQGVIGTLKHWPGLGADTVDPHYGLPVLNRSQADLNKIDFAPYRALIAQGNVDMIMSTHELVPAYDPNLPASLSPILIDQVLRHDLGFQGVVMTDSLYMGAISQHWSAGQAAVLAVLAGSDLLLGPYNIPGVQEMLDALKAAVESGQISKARIDLSMQRILALKIKYGLMKVPLQG
jgi:beta-N-acetylhexosaminidase